MIELKGAGQPPLRQRTPLAVRVEEAAELLCLPRSTAYEYIARGIIPSVRIGARIRVPVAALEKMLQEAADAKTTPRP